MRAPDFVLSHAKTLGPCTVVPSDEIVVDAKSRVRAAIAVHMEVPMALLSEFEGFACLMNGEEEAKVGEAKTCGRLVLLTFGWSSP